MMNSKTYAPELTRLEICDLLIATTTIGLAVKEGENNPYVVNKWEKLHDKLKRELARLDAENGF